MDGRQRISSGSPYELTVGYSRAIRVADRVVVAGSPEMFEAFTRNGVWIHLAELRSDQGARSLR